MRDDRIKKRWTAEIAPFQMAIFPVTRGLVHPAGVDHPDLPVTDVSWFDAVRFCNALSEAHGLPPCYQMPDTHDDGIEFTCDMQADGYRLPTEAEWQYACQAGTTDYRYGPLDDIAWHTENSGDLLQPVGQKAPNAWGLYDLLGNVWEWCWDLYDVEVYRSYRILRGGSFADEPRSSGATTRRRTHPSFRLDEIGFRLVRSGQG